jgi:hypothetical protein
MTGTSRNGVRRTAPTPDNPANDFASVIETFGAGEPGLRLTTNPVQLKRSQRRRAPCETHDPEKKAELRRKSNSCHRHPRDRLPVATGGGLGIRTLETFLPTSFQDWLHRPLGQPSLLNTTLTPDSSGPRRYRASLDPNRRAELAHPRRRAECARGTRGTRGTSRVRTVEARRPVRLRARMPSPRWPRPERRRAPGPWQPRGRERPPR